MPYRRQHILIRYVVAILTVALAHAAGLLLVPVLEGHVSPLFLTAVMVSALYGGLGPGLLAGVLSAFASAFFYVPPYYSLDIGFDDFLRLVVFMIMAALISWLSAARKQSEEALRAARDELELRVRQRTEELRQANERLTLEVIERQRGQEQILAHRERLRSLASDLSRSEERERRRIAIALHDGIGHALAASVIKLRTLMQTESLDGAEPQIEAACNLVEKAIEYTRSLTLELSPPILYELGLVAAVEWLAEQFEQRHGIAVSVVDDESSAAIPEEIRGVLFAAIRELLVNVIKHAKASSVSIEIARPDRRLHVVVRDDGAGFDSQLRQWRSAGFGLFNIRERISGLGGSIDIQSTPGAGCTVALSVPLPLPLTSENPTGVHS
jgi:signal transduction histidine kinase